MDSQTRTQVEAGRHTVLAVAHRDRATLVVTGADRVSWLNGLLTADLAKRKDGEVTYGLVVGRNGKILADAFVGLDESRMFVSVPIGVVEGLRRHLDHYLVMEDAEVTRAGDDVEAWALHGPESSAAFAAIRAAGAIGGTLDRTGLGGAFAFAPGERAAAVRAALERYVGEHGGALAGDGGWEALRLERAVARFGADFDDKTYPQEAALEKVAVSFEKGCYLGQEVVCMLEMRGHVKRKLAALVIESTDPALRGSPVVDEAGAAVGEITSAAFSPTLGKVVALAMLKRASAELGSRVAVGAAGLDGVRAQVVAQPA